MSYLRSSALPGLQARARAYRDCEAGSATLWNLGWLLGFAGIAGVAIDASDGYRNKSMLQSTADVAALAGVMSLPNLELEKEYLEGTYGEVETQAEKFAYRNLGPEHGPYFDPETYEGDIRIGHWNVDTRLFIEGAAPVNAVRVEHARVSERKNGVGTAILGLVGHNFWDVRTTATAMRGLDPCLLNGIVARESLSLKANKMEIFGDVCVHGQLMVEVSPGGLWNQEDALSLGNHKPSVSNPWTVHASQYELVDGVKGDDITGEMQDPNDHWDRDPAMVDQIVEIGWSMMAAVEGYRHFSYPRTELPDGSLDGPLTWEQQPEVIRLPDRFWVVDGTYDPNQDTQEPDEGTQTWWQIGGATQLASLDGLSAVAALLGAAQVPSPAMVIDYHGSYDYTDGVHTQSGNTSNDFSWPANKTDIDIEATVTIDGVDHAVRWTDDPAKGAPIETTATLTEGKIYFADNCQADTLTLQGHIKNVTIVTNCKIDIAGGAVIENAVLLTTSAGASESSANVKQAIQVSNGATIGSVCDDWGTVRMYSNGDINAVVPSGQEAQSVFHGVQMVAREDISFAARADMSEGISLLAGGKIEIRPQAKLGAISADASQTGCPQVGGIEFEFDAFAYDTALVR